jgi:hypothetical protein
VGYVGGLRAVLPSEVVVNAGVLPKDIYADCILVDGISESVISTTLRASALNTPLSNYVDGQGRQHYVVKLASISTSSAVTDLRKTIAQNSALFDHLISLLATKASTNSPQFDGSPTAPTPVTGSNNTQLATTQFVQTAVNLLIGAAPGALNALDELAAALGNDPNFATTITNLIATKAAANSAALTGTPTAPTAAPGTNTAQLSTTAFVVAAINALATVARTGNAAHLTGTLNPGQLPFSYGVAASASHVAQRDGNGHLWVPNVALNEYSVKAANTAFVIDYVASAISSLISSAPGTLDTLNEIAAALGNDPNFATTITNLIAAKAPLNSPAFGGVPTAPTAALGTNNTQLATTAFVKNMVASTSLVWSGSASSVSVATWGAGTYLIKLANTVYWAVAHYFPGLHTNAFHDTTTLLDGSTPYLRHNTLEITSTGTLYGKFYRAGDWNYVNVTEIRKIGG